MDSTPWCCTTWWPCLVHKLNFLLTSDCPKWSTDDLKCHYPNQIKSYTKRTKLLAGTRQTFNKCHSCAWEPKPVYFSMKKVWYLLLSNNKCIQQTRAKCPLRARLRARCSERSKQGKIPGAGLQEACFEGARVAVKRTGIWTKAGTR